MSTMMTSPDWNRSVTIECQSPDGKLWLNIVEDNSGKPVQFICNIGKAGTSLSAWCNALMILMTALASNGIGVNTLIELLSDITSDKIRYQHDSKIRSGVEAIVWCLYRYREGKFQELKESLGVQVDRTQLPERGE